MIVDIMNINHLIYSSNQINFYFFKFNNQFHFNNFQIQYFIFNFILTINYSRELNDSHNVWLCISYEIKIDYFRSSFTLKKVKSLDSNMNQINNKTIKSSPSKNVVYCLLSSQSYLKYHMMFVSYSDIKSVFDLLKFNE